jgi:hypothetical protein
MTMLQKFKLWKDAELRIPLELRVNVADIVVVAYGCAAPLILRHEQSDGFFRFVNVALVLEKYSTTPMWSAKVRGERIWRETSSGAARWGNIRRQVLSSAEDRLEWFNVK